MAKTTLRLVVPTTENRTVGPRRPKNAELRTREHLTPDEAELLIEAAKRNRHGQRDGLMVLLAYRHGLRAAEVVDLRWEQVDFKTASLHVRRVKNGTPSTHPLTGRELRLVESPSAGKRALAVRIRVGTRCTSIRAWFLPHDREGSEVGEAWHQGPCPYVAACNGL